jgi:hypothetical protein
MHIFTLVRGGICIAYEMSRALLAPLSAASGGIPKAAGTGEERVCEKPLVVSILYARRGLNVHATTLRADS